MWTVTFRLNGERDQKIFYNLICMRRFLKRQSKNPRFKLVEVMQVMWGG